MKKRLKSLALLAIGSCSLVSPAVAQGDIHADDPYMKYPSVWVNPYSITDSYIFKKESIEKIIRKAAEYHLASYNGDIPTRNWQIGTFYSGFIAAYDVTGDKWYLDKANEWGELSEWDINKTLNADDVCPGQTYLDLYFETGNKKAYETIDNKLKEHFGKEMMEPGAVHPGAPSKPLTGRNVWSWCDALYMAPPVYARLGKATGDDRYYEMLDRLYWDSVDFLYAPEERLFHRNSKEQTESERTPNGKKVFWGRGEGWVVGGLSRMIEFLPESMQPKYLDLYRDMCYALAEFQQEDGMWRSSVNDPSWYPLKETSGSSFFVYAMAKGINEGWLPRDYFMPIVLRGWSGLVSCVDPDGRLGYSQIVAGSPYPVRPHDTMDYAVGAFMLAGSEVVKLNPDVELDKIQEARKSFKPQVVAKDGAWTWYNDERVIYQSRVFFASYVKRSGKSAFSTFAVQEHVPSAFVYNENIMSSWNWSDDHNNASLLDIGGDSILATYTTHGKTKSFYQRYISRPRPNQLAVSEEREIPVETTGRGTTYQNLHRLSDENGRIYTFYRGINFNPTLCYSDDLGKTWGNHTWLIASGSNNNRRPYVKYLSNGKDRIDFLFTDGHPRDVPNNSVYHMYYKDGKFYTSTGKVIRKMKDLENKPIKPEEATLIYDGSGEMGRGWVYDLEYDENGAPHAAFISAPHDDKGFDLRYWDATFDGKKWHADEIAFAGSNLTDYEQHYAGGFALKPGDSKSVVISADVNPETGEALPVKRYQLFSGVKIDGDWEWTQLTFDPLYDHLRPVIARGEIPALFWFSGIYRGAMDFETDIMMSYEY